MLRHLVIVVVVWGGALPLPAADDIRIGDPIPDEIVANWERRQTETTGLHCEYEWRRMFAPGYLNLPHTPVEKYGLLPKEETWIENHYTLWLDFETPRARTDCDGFIHCSDDDVMDFVPFRKIFLFDGEGLQVYEPLDDNPYTQSLNPRAAEIRECVPDGRYLGMFFDGTSYPVCWGHGIGINFEHGLMANALRSPIDPHQYRVAALGRAPSGGTLVTLRSVPFGFARNQVLEFDVDMGRDCVITRRSQWIDDYLKREYHIEPIETERGWMPQSWTYTVYNSFVRDGRVGESSECRVVVREFDPDFSSVAFHVEPHVGEFFNDEATQTSFLKSPDGEADVEWRTALILEEQAHGWWRRWTVIVGLLAIIVLGLALRYRQTMQ